MATTLEELVVKLEADNKAFIAQMQQGQKAVTDSLGKIETAIKETSEQGQKDTSALQGAFATMAGFIGGQAVIGAFNFVKESAAALFESLVIGGVEASSESINAFNKLQVALAQTGQLTGTVAQDFAAYAGEIQKTTKFGDDAVISAGALIQQLGRLDAEGLQRATQASVDLAAALGIDLETAAQMVGKAAAGNTQTFGRLGIEIEKGSTKAETFSNTLRALERFQGSAVAQSQTYSGSVVKLGNAYEDLQKQVGFSITQNVAVVDVIGAVTKQLFGAADGAAENQQALREMVAQGIVVAIDAVTAFIAGIDTMGRFVKGTVDAVGAYFFGMATAIAYPLNLLGIISDETFTALKDSAVDAATSVTEAFTRETALEQIGVKMAEIGQVAEAGLEKVRSGAIATVEPVNQTTVAVAELSAETQRLVDEGQKLAETYVAQSANAAALAEEQVRQAELVRDAKLAAIRAEADGNMMSVDSLYERRQAELAVEQEFAAAKMEALVMQQDGELAAVQTAYENQKIEKEAYEAAKLGIEQKYRQQATKLALDEVKFKQQMMDQEVKDRQSQIQTLSALQNSQNEYSKTVGKAFAVANTIIKTQEGAQAAYAALAGIPLIGPGLGAAAAAAVIADGASRIATIRGAQTGITEVPGIGTRDSFGPVALAPGERVVDGPTNQDLKAAIARILSNEVGGGGQMEVVISLKDGLMDFIETQLVQRRSLGVGQGA